MVSHWSLSKNKSPQISRTLFSILANFNNAVIWIVSIHPIISKSSSPCTNPLVNVPRAPITIGIIITFMFHSFFNSLAWSRYLSPFSHSFDFTLWSASTAKSTIMQVLFFLLIIIRSGHLAEIWWFLKNFIYYYYYYYYLIFMPFGASPLFTTFSLQPLKTNVIKKNLCTQHIHY